MPKPFLALPILFFLTEEKPYLFMGAFGTNMEPAEETENRGLQNRN